MACASAMDHADAPAPHDIGNAIRDLAPNEILFRAGDPKTQVHRVESGVICLYDTRWNGYRTVVEFAYPGDLIGLGFLDSHTLNARAIVESRIVSLPPKAVEEILANDPRAEARLAEAIEREFEARRDYVSDTGQTRPVDRVAALLVNLSCSNAYEGRDPHLITDCWDCGTMAVMLGLGIDEFKEILVELEKRDFVEPDFPKGLRLKNLDALEALADGPAKVPDRIFVYENRPRPPKVQACSAADGQDDKASNFSSGGADIAASTLSPALTQAFPRPGEIEEKSRVPSAEMSEQASRQTAAMPASPLLLAIAVTLLAPVIGIGLFVVLHLE